MSESPAVNDFNKRISTWIEENKPYNEQAIYAAIFAMLVDDLAEAKARIATLEAGARAMMPTCCPWSVDEEGDAAREDRSDQRAYVAKAFKVAVDEWEFEIFVPSWLRLPGQRSHGLLTGGSFGTRQEAQDAADAIMREAGWALE